MVAAIEVRVNSRTHIERLLPNPSLQRTCASCAGWSAEFKRWASQT